MQFLLLFYLKHGGLVSSIGADIIWGGCVFRSWYSYEKAIPWILGLLLLCSNYCCRVLYLQQLYSCYYLERLLIIGLILSCRCYCFYYRSNWFNRLLLLYERFVSGSSASVRWRYRQYVPVPNPLFFVRMFASDLLPIYPVIHTLSECDWVISGSNTFNCFVRACFWFAFDLSCYSHVVRVRLSDFRFQFFDSFCTIVSIRSSSNFLI